MGRKHTRSDRPEAQQDVQATAAAPGTNGSVQSMTQFFRAVEARTVSHQAEAWTPTCGQAVRAPISPQSKKMWRAAVGISAKLFADADDRPHRLASPLQAGAVPPPLRYGATSSY